MAEKRFVKLTDDQIDRLWKDHLKSQSVSRKTRCW